MSGGYHNQLVNTIKDLYGIYPKESEIEELVEAVLGYYKNQGVIPVSTTCYTAIKETLKPFADLCVNGPDKCRHSDASTCEWRIKASDLRNARRVLAMLEDREKT